MASAVVFAGGVSLFAGAWIGLAEKAFALAGAVMLARPFFRDNRWHRAIASLSAIEPGGGGAADAIEWEKARAAADLATLRPLDYRDACIGLGLLILSFVLGTLAEFGKLMGALPPR